jgi:hypothetical protein
MICLLSSLISITISQNGSYVLQSNNSQQYDKVAYPRNAMPFCRECGKEVDDSWLHCPHCGSQQPIERQPSVLIQDSVVTNETNITIYNDPEIITRGVIAAIVEYNGDKNQSQVKLPQPSKEVAKSMIPRMSMGDRFALVVRCNPNMWNWSAEIPELGTAVIPWRTRLKAGSVGGGVPAVVLATKGGGVIAAGRSVGSIRITAGSKDNNWREGHKEKARSHPRLPLELERIHIPYATIKSSTVSHLINRQSTMSWITKEEYLELMSLKY